MSASHPDRHSFPTRRSSDLKGDHWYGLRPPEVSQQRPNSVDNVVWSQIESIVSKLTGWEPTTDFEAQEPGEDRKSTRLNSSHPSISYAVFCLKNNNAGQQDQ